MQVFANVYMCIRLYLTTHQHTVSHMKHVHARSDLFIHTLFCTHMHVLYVLCAPEEHLTFDLFFHTLLCTCIHVICMLCAPVCADVFFMHICACIVCSNVRYVRAQRSTCPSYCTWSQNADPWLIYIHTSFLPQTVANTIVMYVRMYLNLYKHMEIQANTAHTHTYIHIHTLVYIRTHTHTHTHTQQLQPNLLSQTLPSNASPDKRRIEILENQVWENCCMWNSDSWPPQNGTGCLSFAACQTLLLPKRTSLKTCYSAKVRKRHGRNDAHMSTDISIFFKTGYSA